MYNRELRHYGILGQKWGVRRTKEQLARLTGRKKEDISDEEAEEFRSDVDNVHLANKTKSDAIKNKTINSLIISKGQDYTSMVMRQADKETIESTFSKLALSAAVVIGSAFVKNIAKTASGEIDIGNGTTVKYY